MDISMTIVLNVMEQTQVMLFTVVWIWQGEWCGTVKLPIPRLHMYIRWAHDSALINANCTQTQFRCDTQFPCDSCDYGYITTQQVRDRHEWLHVKIFIAASIPTTNGGGLHGHVGRLCEGFDYTSFLHNAKSFTIPTISGPHPHCKRIVSKLLVK